jgi:hypothetical protein
MVTLDKIRRPYDGRGANVINAMISVTRVLSMVCILIFVEELGIAASTRTITGVILLAIQSTLTIILAVLVVISAIASCMHKRKPVIKRKPLGTVEEIDPLGIPMKGTSEMKLYPRARTPKGGYVPAPTSEEAGYHRASTIQKPLDTYEEYSPAYMSRPQSGGMRVPSPGHGRAGSLGHDSDFQYQAMGSPPPVPSGR